jgi:hypothetical protein
MIVTAAVADFVAAAVGIAQTAIFPTAPSSCQAVDSLCWQWDWWREGGVQRMPTVDDGIDDEVLR